MYKQSEFMKALWLDLIHDLTNEDVHYFFSVYFRSTDPLVLIEDAQRVADYVLGIESVPRGNKFMLLYDLYYDQHNASSIRKLLQLTRFPKRYVPDEAPKTDFWETNRRIRDRHWSPTNYVISELRLIMADLLADYNVNYDEWSLTTGATYTVPREGSNYRRLLEAELVDPQLLGPTLATPLSNIIKSQRLLGADLNGLHSNRMQGVPKNWKSLRNIAIEWEYNNIRASSVASAIERCLPDFVELHNQMRNYNLAKLGSVDNSISTIDLHAASDSVSRELCALILPTNVCYDIEKVVAWNATDKKWSKNYHRTYFMMSTMGNRVTFPLESLIFSAVVLLAFKVNGHKPTVSQRAMTAVYGDDIIVPTEIAETTIDLLECIGFEVNRSKTFIGNEYFRESCGGEFYKGQQVSTIYWPRKKIGLSKQYLPNLISLQHKLYMLPRCNTRLCKVLRSLYPAFTESYPDSPYDDIWTPYPNIKRAWGSYANGGKEEEPSCEVHTMMCTNYENRFYGTTDAERYLYYEYLKHGPLPFGDDVMDSLGYTKARSIDQFCGTPTVEPKNVKVLI